MDRQALAQIIADDLLKLPKDGGNHGCMIPHSKHLDGFIVRGHVDLLSIADAILAAQQDGAREAWQPIETAENDNVVWVCNPNEGTLPVLAWKIENMWYEYGVYGKQLRPTPTYWMKWPKLPKVSAVEQHVSTTQEES